MNRGRLKFPGKRLPRLHKNGTVRLNWKHWETGEGPTMVRGTNRRVVVVKSPDPQIFEEAIFVIRDDLFRREGSADAVLREARKAANAYLRRTTAPRRTGWFARLPASLYAGLGAAAAGIAWLALRLVGV